MANKIEYYNPNTSSWTDISSVITACSIIPYDCRNRDWTLRNSDVSISVAITVRELLNDDIFNFSANGQFRIYQGASFVYGGFLEKNIYNYQSMEFELGIKNNLATLESKLVDYDTLHSAFATGANWYEWTPSTYASREGIVGLLWAMKKMFSVCGLILTTSDVDDVAIMTMNGSETFRDCAVTFKDLFFYENILYCANQDINVIHNYIDTPTFDYNKNKINFFEVVSELLTSLRLHLVQTDIITYNLVYDEDNYTIADDDKYSFSEEIFSKEVNDFVNNLSYTYFFNDPITYAGAGPTNDGSFVQGKGQLLPSIKNFVICYSDAKLNTNKYVEAYALGYCSQLLFDLTTTLVINDNSSNAGINAFAMRAKALALDYVQEKITTNFESTHKPVIENFFDIEWTNSEIVQESYNE